MRYAWCLVLLACWQVTGPPDGAVPIDPIPAEYARWWSEAEECSGRRGDFSRVRWMTGVAENYVDWRERTIYLVPSLVDKAHGVRTSALVYLLPGAESIPPHYQRVCEVEMRPGGMP